MYALVVDNEFQGFVEASAVRRAIETGLHVEVATFNPLRGWVPVCLEKFHDFVSSINPEMGFRSYYHQIQ